MILVDTNVISQLTRLRPEQAVFDWIEEREGDLLVSIVTFGEMSFGIARLPNGRRRDGLRLALNLAIDRFSNRTVQYGVYESQAYGDIMANAEKLGRPMSIPG